jgi:hypothetical protein
VCDEVLPAGGARRHCTNDSGGERLIRLAGAIPDIQAGSRSNASSPSWPSRALVPFVILSQQRSEAESAASAGGKGSPSMRRILLGLPTPIAWLEARTYVTADATHQGGGPLNTPVTEWLRSIVKTQVPDPEQSPLQPKRESGPVLAVSRTTAPHV